MPIEIIVSYDASNMDQDALALGQVLAGERNSLALAYVRHAKEEGDEREQLAAADAAELLDGGARLLGQPDAPRFIVFGASTPEGLSQLATSEQASLIVFGSEYRTADGHVEPQSSARRLLEGHDGLPKLLMRETGLSPSRRLAFASATVIRRSRRSEQSLRKTTPVSRRPPSRSRCALAPRSLRARRSRPISWSSDRRSEHATVWSR